VADDDTRKRLLRVAKLVEIRKPKMTIYNEGEWCKHVYVVLEGQLGVFQNMGFFAANKKKEREYQRQRSRMVSSPETITKFSAAMQRKERKSRHDNDGDGVGDGIEMQQMDIQVEQAMAEAQELGDLEQATARRRARRRSVEVNIDLDGLENLVTLSPGSVFGESTVLQCVPRRTTVVTTRHDGDDNDAADDAGEQHLNMENKYDEAAMMMGGGLGVGVPSADDGPAWRLLAIKFADYHHLVLGSNDKYIAQKRYARLRPFYMPRAGNDLSNSERMYKAGNFIKDAAHGRRLRPYRVNRCARTMDWFFNSSLYSLVMAMVVIFHMLLIIWEPPASRDRDVEPYKSRLDLLAVIEAGICGLYLVETVFNLRDLGCHGFCCSSPRHVIYLLVILIILADVSIASIVQSVIDPGAAAEFMRVSRFVRPVLLIIRFKSVRRLYILTVRMLPKLFEVLLILLIVFVFFAVTGLFLFKEHRALYDQAKYNAGDTFLFPHCEGVACEPLPESTFESFSNSYGHAFLSLWVLLSTTNYPSFALPAAANSHFYHLYFVAFLIISYFFLMSVIVAVMYSTSFSSSMGRLVVLRFSLSHTHTQPNSHSLTHALTTLRIPNTNRMYVRRIYIYLCVYRRLSRGKL
jgi:CRP-like cAMP-binding protein